MRQTEHTPIANLFAALSNQDRLLLLALLREQPQTVKALRCAFPHSQPTISRHLKILFNAGLVHRTPKGKHNYYHFVPSPNLLRVLDEAHLHCKINT